MRRVLFLLFVALCLATAGCGLLRDLFDLPDNSNAADERDIYKAKTGRDPPSF
jgi:predicted small lipoprotein YifL